MTAGCRRRAELAGRGVDVEPVQFIGPSAGPSEITGAVPGTSLQINDQALIVFRICCL